LVELELDVSDALPPGRSGRVAASVTLPDPGRIPERPIVCFAKPGGGFSRRYYTLDLPGPARGSQASWHADRGWIFVASDVLGAGDSSADERPEHYDFTSLAAAAHAAEQAILDRLASGDLVEGYPPVADVVRVGIGQSMGGCMTVIQQGRHQSYDGIGVLGYSVLHSHPPVQPGAPEFVTPWIPRDVVMTNWLVGDWAGLPGIVNKASVAASPRLTYPEMRSAMRWCFYYDDVDFEEYGQDFARFCGPDGSPPPWVSPKVPPVAISWCMTPGAAAPEAAGVVVPVLLAMGERDVCTDPMGEPRAFRSASSVDLFRCPRMGHMHNFAGTRELLWQRIATWADWVRAHKSWA
jgi:hypothetical protein